MTDYVLGVDGGGTGCRAAVAAADGPILGLGMSGAANILTDPDLALAHIEAAARAAIREAGLPADVINKVPAVLGLADNNQPDALNLVLPRLPFSQSVIYSDGLIALQGALGPGDGVLASLGTGTVYLLRHQGDVRQFGGYGFFLGDQGSGARIGQEALRETLLAHDGIKPASPLTEDLLAHFGHDTGAMLAFARHAAPGDFARFAPQVFAAADAGDAVAKAVLAQAAADVNAMLDHLLSISGPTPLCLAGGLGKLYLPHLAERHRSRLAKPLGDALSGAISLARTCFLATEVAS